MSFREGLQRDARTIGRIYAGLKNVNWSEVPGRVKAEFQRLQYRSALDPLGPIGKKLSTRIRETNEILGRKDFLNAPRTDHAGYEEDTAELFSSTEVTSANKGQLFVQKIGEINELLATLAKEGKDRGTTDQLRRHFQKANLDTQIRELISAGKDYATTYLNPDAERNYFRRRNTA